MKRGGFLRLWGCSLGRMALYCTSADVGSSLRNGVGLTAERFKHQLASVVGWVKRQATDNPLGMLLAVILLILLTVIVWETDRQDNMGFSARTF